MLHTCAARFDVTVNLENFWELNKALVGWKTCCFHRHTQATNKKERKEYMFLVKIDIKLLEQVLMVSLKNPYLMFSSNTLIV